MTAKSFCYACAGISLLITAWTMGARHARADDAAPIPPRTAPVETLTWYGVSDDSRKEKLIEKMVDGSGPCLLVEEYDKLPLLVLTDRIPPWSAKRVNAIGLTSAEIDSMVELRLRQAKVFRSAPSSSSGHSLVVNAKVLGDVFYIDLDFRRKAQVLLPEGRSYDAHVTCTRSSTLGLHKSSSTLFLEKLDEQLDRFLSVYIRVNERNRAYGNFR